jgi:uncharacterized protein YjbJ (UPF0337 family)
LSDYEHLSAAFDEVNEVMRMMGLANLCSCRAFGAKLQFERKVRCNNVVALRLNENLARKVREEANGLPSGKNRNALLEVSQSPSVKWLNTDSRDPPSRLAS